GTSAAGARRGVVGVDAVVERAKAVLLAQPLVLAAQVGDLVQFEREPHGVERRTPLGALAEHIAKEGEAVRLLGAARGALIGDVGGARGTLEQQLALVVARRPD